MSGYCSANGGGLGGIEGQYYVGNTTLYGQAGYGGQFNNGNCGTAEYFPHVLPQLPEQRFSPILRNEYHMIFALPLGVA